MIYFLIIFIILLIVSIYINLNMLRKFEVAEKYNDELYAYIFYVQNTVDEMHSAIKAIDRRGSFEADDEVGYFFKSLKEIVEELNKLTMDSTNKESV